MAAENRELRSTPLMALHQEYGARLVPFAGYTMPVQYPGGIIAEHKHVREHAGLFDVSHMGQILVRGAAAAAALETRVPADVASLEPGQQRYALFTNEKGGIRDDLMITRLDDAYLLVVNAAVKQQDFAYLREHLAQRCDVQWWAERALLALQGPQAAPVLSRLNPAANELVFMTGAMLEFDGTWCSVTRSGYSGEDGFEISVPAHDADALARRLLSEPEVKPVGLGARDSLRLEAGLCLYGHDIDASTTPVAAGLSWSIGKTRRSGGTREGGFPGAEIILAQIPGKTEEKRVGIRPAGRVPVRAGAVLVDGQGAPAGRITSGGFGPTAGGPVAMGYVIRSLSEPGTPLHAMVREKPVAVQVAELPFVKPNYHRS